MENVVLVLRDIAEVRFLVLGEGRDQLVLNRE